MNKKKLIPILFAITMFLGTASATVISVSDIDYESNAEFFDGELIAVEMVADDSTETIQVDNIPANTISDQITGTTEQDIQIEATQVDKYVEYSISDSDKIPVNKVSAVNEKGFNTASERDTWANNNCEFGEFYENSYITITGIKYEALCFQRAEKLASIGDFREDSTSPRSQFEVKYEISVDGQPTETVTLSSSDVGSGTTTSVGNQVKFEWLGNYDLTTSPEGTSSGALAAQSDDFSSGWRVVSDDEYEDYRQHIEFNVGNRLKDWFDGERSKEQIESEFNGYALDAVSEYTTHPLSEGRITDAGINDGTLQYNPDAELFHPSFLLYINAGDQTSDAITISRSAGVPEIQSVSGGEVQEIGKGEINLVAKNAGSQEGQFEARISSCTNGFDYDDAIRERTIDSGSTSEFTFQMSFDGDSGTDDISGACEVQLKETTSGVTTTQNVELTGVQEGQCNADSPYPTVKNGNEAIAECQDGKEVITETCTNDEVTDFTDGEWVCSEEGTTSGGDGWFGTSFTPFQDISDALSGGLGFIQTVSLVMGVIVTFAASLFTFGFSYRSLFNTFMLDEVTKDFGVAQNLVRLAFAGVLTALVGFLVYTIATNIWIQLLTLVGVLIAGYLYIQFGGIAKSLT